MTDPKIEQTDFERLGVAVNEFTKALSDTFAPTITAAVEAMNRFAEWMPGRAFRKARKRRQIREHAERKAARVPAWKRVPKPLDMESGDGRI